MLITTGAKVMLLEEFNQMLISDEISKLDIGSRSHVAGAFSTTVLRRLEELLPENITATVETGCGKSTIMLSNKSPDHTVFCIEDRDHEESSINFFETCHLTKNDNVTLVLGPTQKTLPTYDDFKQYDVVLIDGPHGFPFPEIEYYYFYPHIKPGGILIVDDAHIATIGRLADFIAEDAMFDFVELVSTTAVFRRTDAETFDPTGDGWWLQDFNRRRIQKNSEYLAPYALADKNMLRPFADTFGDSVSSLPEDAKPVQSSLGIGHRLFGAAKRVLNRV